VRACPPKLERKRERRRKVTRSASVRLGGTGKSGHPDFKNMPDIYQILKKLNIQYTEHKHPAVYTVEEAERFRQGIDALHCKSLFIRNKKGDKNYLVIIRADKRLKLKALQEELKESRLSFASESRLKKYLGVTPGAVSPFGLINDSNQEVMVVIDNDIWRSQKVAFHPNINTITLVIKTTDFKKFLSGVRNQVRYFNC